MREQTSTEEDCAIGIIPAAPWRVAQIQAISDFRLTVRFNDGVEGEADLSRLIWGERAGVFTALRDPMLFAKAELEHGAVTWPGDIDLPPDAMHDAIEAEGRWVPE